MPALALPVPRVRFRWAGACRARSRAAVPGACLTRVCRYCPVGTSSSMGVPCPTRGFCAGGAAAPVGCASDVGAAPSPAVAGLPSCEADEHLFGRKCFVVLPAADAVSGFRACAARGARGGVLDSFAQVCRFCFVLCAILFRAPERLAWRARFLQRLLCAFGARVCADFVLLRVFVSSAAAPPPPRLFAAALRARWDKPRPCSCRSSRRTSPAACSSVS